MSDGDGLAAAAASGDRLEALKALRDTLAADLDACESLRDKASLSQRFMDCLAQIEAAEKARPQQKGTPLDELASRRTGKAAPARPPRAGRG